LWLIATFPALHLNIENYPAVKEYLLSFGQKLEQTGNTYIDEKGNKIKCRKRTNNKWFEVQDTIAYYEEFEKEKIVWQRITKKPTFCFSKPNELTLDSMAFLSNFNEIKGKYILSFVNSTIIDYWVSTNVHQYGSSGYRL